VHRVAPPPPRIESRRAEPPRIEAHRPPPRVEHRVFGYAHPPREHQDREGYYWVPGHGREGHWAPRHRPSPHHMWIPGHWRGDAWINGHWSLRR